MSHSIKHLFHINAKRSDVYKAITGIKELSEWWTTGTSGDASVNGIIKFRFGDFGGPDMKVVSMEKNKKVKWKCVSDDHGWKGHTYTFLLDDNEGKTCVRFSHDGWKKNDDFYAHCCFSWGRYMESLRQLCQTGKGEAFGSKNFRK